MKIRVVNSSVFRFLKFNYIESIILDAKHDEIKIANFLNNGNFRFFSENPRNGYNIQDMASWRRVLRITKSVNFSVAKRIQKSSKSCKCKVISHSVEFIMTLIGYDSKSFYLSKVFLTSAWVSLKCEISYPRVVRFSEVLFNSW